MNRIAGLFFAVLLVMSMSMLIIPGVGIAIGLANRHWIQPLIEWAQDPGPLYVEDDRCCR